MDKRKLAIALAILAVLIGAAIAYAITRDMKAQQKVDISKFEEKQEDRLREACASNATYARLKEVVFEEAVRIRNSDPANLDTLAAHSVVRMEQPVVKSRDENLNVTVCTGKFVLELPPGAEAGFEGARRLTADIEYAAQAAADGSGLVYQLDGAEPIIYRLAAFDLQGRRFRAPGSPPDAEFAEAAPAPLPPPLPSQPVAEPAPPAPPPVARVEPPAERRAPAPPPRPPEVEARPEPARSTSSRPSFNCRSARSRSERMVCSSDRLAAKDRAMSSLFYSALADGDSRTRAELRRTRDRFLAYRERCRTEACIAEAYDGRMAEIRDIMAEAE